MKFLVIGGTGQLGSSIINNLSCLNHEIVAPSKQQLNITKIRNNKSFHNLLKKSDYVINCAAYNNVIGCESNLLCAFDVNFIAVKNIAEACNFLNVPFITFSTDYVFDGKKGTEYIETDLPQPVNTYGISKLSGEYAALMYENNTVIRTCGLYGLQSKTTKDGRGNFIDNRIEDSKTCKYLQMGYDQIVSPTYADDLSKAVIQLIEHPIKKYNLYHLVNEGHCTWYELTKEIYEILNLDVEVIPIDRCGMFGKVRNPRFSALRNERAKELGIMLPHWKDALKRYIETKYKALST